MPRFEQPKTNEEAQKRLIGLKEEAVNIQVQLMSKNKTNSDGNRLTTSEFWEWRKKAVYALNCKKSEMMFLKRWIDNPNDVRDSEPIQNDYAKYPGYQGSDVVDLLGDAYHMLKEIIEELGDDVTRGEMDKMEEIRSFLKNMEVEV